MTVAWEASASLLLFGSGCVLLSSFSLHWVETRGVPDKVSPNSSASAGESASSTLVLDDEVEPYEEWQEEPEGAAAGIRLRENDWFLYLLWIFGVLVLTLAFGVVFRFL
jgi:hypothetical protein